MKFWAKLRALFRKEKLDAEMVEEMTHHLEEQTQSNVRAGLSLPEAGDTAQRQFGNLGLIQERARDVRRWRWLEDVAQDVRVGLRVLWKERGFTIASVAVLALGIGAVTTQFSIVDAAVLRGLPLPEADRLMRIAVRDPSWAPERDRGPWVPDAYAFAAQQQSFIGLAQYTFADSFIVTIGDVPQRYSGSHVTPNFFSVLGVRPAMGRDFTEADNQIDAERVTIISDAMWQRDFGGDPEILGREFRLNGRVATVIGVMPAGFTFPRDQLWMPAFNAFRWDGSRPWWALNVVGRLKPGVQPEQAAAEWGAFLAALATEYPETNGTLTVARVEPLLHAFVGRNLRRMLGAMLGAVGAVLLIACANVMNLQFARAAMRARELALRSALGASRGRLVRQMLTECLLLAIFGAMAGTLLARWAIGLLQPAAMATLPPGVQPMWWQFAIDERVLAFTVMITAAAVLASGMLPAFLSTRRGPGNALKEGSRGQVKGVARQTMGALVAGQIALTCALLISAVLLVKSITNQLSVDFGFDADALLCGRMNLDADYGDSPEARRTALNRLLTQLRANPQFEAAALTTRRNMITNDSPWPFEIEGRTYARPEERPEAWAEIVSDGYFATLGMQPIVGREFEPHDGREGRRAVLINESFARKHFGADNRIGRRMRDNDRDEWRTIIGIVPDTLMQGPLEQQFDGAGFFLPVEEQAPVYISVVVRGRGPVAALTETLRRETGKVDPNLAVYLVNTARGHMAMVLAQGQTVAVLFSIFAAVSAMLAAVGLYGVMSFAVNARTREFGVRLALGAQACQITSMVLAQGGRQMLIGIVAGLVLTLALARVSESLQTDFLYQVSPRDPIVYAGVIIFLAAVALLACWLPARRAAKVDPMVALRAE